MKNHQQINGFTLLEIIISTFLLSLIAVICGMALRTGIGVYDRLTKNQHGFEKTTINYYRLFDQLKHVKQFIYKNRRYTLFKGSDNYIEFISDVSITSAMPGFYKVRYEFEDGTLYIQEIRILDMEYFKKDWTDIEKKEFLSNIEEFSIEYLSNNNWYSSWSKNSIPSAVKIYLKTDKDKIEFIVPFIIGMKLGK